MLSEWKPLLDFANGLSVVAVVVGVGYLLVSGKLHTAQHTEDVVKGLRDRIADLLGERDAAVKRDEESRRELSENTNTLQRLEGTLRAALDALARRR